MGLIDELVKLGADENDAMERFMGNRAFYERMLKKFPKAIDDNPVLPLLEQGSFNEAIAPAHTLKGVAGNLSLTPLYKGYTKVVDDLRSGNNESAFETYKQLLPVQQAMREKIENC